MASENDQFNKEKMIEENIRRLLVSACRPVAASPSFKESLLQQLKVELAKVAKGASPQPASDATLEQNLRRLVASANAPAEVRATFKESLYRQLVKEIAAKPQRQGISIWVPVWATAAVVVILLLGMVIYPIFWADRGMTITASVNQETAVVTQTKPLFFTLGNRSVTSTLTAGDTALLAVGDRIATGANSAVILTLPGDNSIMLYPHSEVVISELRAEGEEGLTVVRARLEAGSATTVVGGLRFEVATPAATVIVAGTDFRLEVVTSEHTFLATYEGVVQLTMEGDSCQVSAGEEVHAIKGQPLVVSPQSPPILLIDSPAQPEVSTSPVTLSGRTDPEATVTVAGQPVTVDVNGIFSTTLELEPGANPVTVVATSPMGRTTTVNLILILEGSS